MIITTANLYLSLSCPHPPSQMGLPNGMAQGVYFRGRVCRKKKSVGILDFGKVPRLGFIFFFFYHNIERKTKVILNQSLVLKTVAHE